MFIGHSAVGFGVKRFAPKVPLAMQCSWPRRCWRTCCGCHFCCSVGRMCGLHRVKHALLHLISTITLVAQPCDGCLVNSFRVDLLCRVPL
jgi:hypothetical protein